MNRAWSAIILIAAASMLVGCSGDAAAPVLLENPSLTVLETADNSSERMILGAWNILFDPSTIAFEVEPVRALSIHVDITKFLTPPECNNCLEIEVLEFLPAEKYIKAKVSLRNESPLVVYDVRAIMVSNIEELKLLNADSYTSLWDDGGDIPINPFKAFATDQPNRIFQQHSGHARICEFKYTVFPDLVKAILVVDASWPGNCSEPYAMNNFKQDIIHYPYGSQGIVSIDIHDWQDDIEIVRIDASEITGQEFNQFTYSTANMWEALIETTNGVAPGTYECRVDAFSVGSELPLYDFVDIEIAPLPIDIETLFEPPAPEEIDLVIMDWESRDVSVHNYVLEGEAVYFDGSTIMIVSHTLEDEIHYGAIRIPPGEHEPDSLPVIVKTHGGGEGTSIYFFHQDSLIGDSFIQVLPSYRGEPFEVQFGALQGTYQSEGDSNAYDSDADDTIALLSVCLENVEEADETRIIISGGSRGGGTSLRTKIRDNRVLASVSFAAATDFFADQIKSSAITHLLDNDFIGVNAVDSGFIKEVIDPLLQGTIDIPGARHRMLLGSPAYFAEHLPRLQVHHGALDPIVPVGQGDSLETQMNLHGITSPDFEYFRYEDGTHDTGTFTDFLIKYEEILIWVLEYE